MTRALKMMKRRWSLHLPDKEEKRVVKDTWLIRWELDKCSYLDLVLFNSFHSSNNCLFNMFYHVQWEQKISFNGIWCSDLSLVIALKRQSTFQTFKFVETYNSSLERHLTVREQPEFSDWFVFMMVHELKSLRMIKGSLNQNCGNIFKIWMLLILGIFKVHTS